LIPVRPFLLECREIESFVKKKIIAVLYEDWINNLSSLRRQESKLFSYKKESIPLFSTYKVSYLIRLDARAGGTRSDEISFL